MFYRSLQASKLNIKTLYETRKNTHYALTSQFPVTIAIFRLNIGTDRIIAYHEQFLL